MRTTARMARRLPMASIIMVATGLLLSSVLGEAGSANNALVPNVLPALINQKASVDNQTTAATPAEIRDELKRKLEEVQSLRDHWDAGPNGVKAPVGIKPEELTEQQRVFESLIFFYQEGLNNLTATESARDDLKAAEAAAGKWTGFGNPPPYSMLMLYGLQEEADALQGKQALLESSLIGLQSDSANQHTEVSRLQAAARLTSDDTERATHPDDHARAIWRQDFAEWRVRAAERNAWFKEIQAGLVNAKLAVVKAELALLEKKIKLARPYAVLSESDIETVHAALKASTRSIEEEQQKAVAENTRWNKEKYAVTRNLEAARANSQKVGAATMDPLPLETLGARLRTADAWVAATSQASESLGTLAVINGHIAEYWNYQYTLLNSLDPKLQQNALSQLNRDFVRLQQWGSFAQDSLMLAVSEEHNQQAKVDSASVDSPLRQFELQTLEAYRLKRQLAERIRLLADRTQLMLGRWLDDYRQRFTDKPIAERMNERMQDAASRVGQIFRFELFTVDDVVDLEGKTVKVSRGVTLGKFITALAVFLVGFWIAKWLSRRFQRMLVRQFQIDEAQSNVLRRWVLMGLSLVLLVTVLTLIRIPLTAFAFLGGALAIGVGFGTQTMLKNLISGVMILVEQKIKVGDIVEVDSILGTVTEIDIRSSTVRGFDGVETMIPNSTFLENKVTNWTYTNLKIRRSVRIGIAYGSPVREVIQLLLDCASRHGQVLAEPKPFVWLEDFGENSLVFGLYFWLEMAPKVSSLQMMSDLRCMMIDALGKAGIVIPFPQRDIHVIPGQPLPMPVATVKTSMTDPPPAAVAKE